MAVPRQSPYFSNAEKLDYGFSFKGSLVDLRSHHLREGGLLPPLMSGTRVSAESGKQRGAGPLARLSISHSLSDGQHKSPLSTEQSPQSASTSHSATPSSYSSAEKADKKKASPFRSRFLGLAIFQKGRSRTFDGSLPAIRAEPDTDGVDGAVLQQPSRHLSNKQSCRELAKSHRSMPMLPDIVPKIADLSPESKHEIKSKSIELPYLEVEQREARNRCGEHESSRLAEIRLRYEQTKKKKVEAQAAAIEEAENKQQEALTSLESRQLEAELRLLDDLDREERQCQIQLRHMEAYCHNGPSPLSTAPLSPRPPPRLGHRSAPTEALPASSTSSSTSTSTLSSTLSSTISSSSEPLPSPFPSFPSSPSSPSSSSSPRTILPTHLHHLARTRNHLANLPDLHESRISVLRNRQEKEYALCVARGEREMARLKAKHGREIGRLDAAAAKKEESATLMG